VELAAVCLEDQALIPPEEVDLKPLPMDFDVGVDLGSTDSAAGAEVQDALFEGALRARRIWIELGKDGRRDLLLTVRGARPITSSRARRSKIRRISACSTTRRDLATSSPEQTSRIVRASEVHGMPSTSVMS